MRHAVANPCFAAGGVKLKQVLFAPIRGNGLLGSWTTSPNELPTGREGPSAVAYQKRRATRMAAAGM